MYKLDITYSWDDAEEGLSRKHGRRQRNWQ